MKEWQAALTFIAWGRAPLDEAGRTAQTVLFLGDGSFDNLKGWKARSDRVVVLVRPATNRALYHLPDPYRGRGAHRKDGDLKQRTGWQATTLTVRARQRRMVPCFWSSCGGKPGNDGAVEGGASPAFLWSAPSSRMGSRCCPCLLKPCCSGLGSAENSKSPTVRASPALVLATSSVGLPTPLWSPSNGRPGSTPSYSWPPSAPGA